MDGELRQKQIALRKVANQASIRMMNNANSLTHRGKQELINEALKKGNLDTVRSIAERAKKENFASRDIKSGVKFDSDGLPKQIGFLLPKHAFLAMLGVGNKHSMGSNRAIFDFYNPSLDQFMPSIADLVAEFSADLLLNAFSTKRDFDNASYSEK